MSCISVNSNYLRKCKDSQGGLSNIWLFPYVKYSRSQIITTNNVLDTFPATTIYPFYSVANPSATDTMETEAGGKYHDQKITLTLQGSEGGFELTKLQTKDYRVIFLDRNGKYRIFGLYNGLEAGSLAYATGSSHSDLNGFKIDFSGKEENEAYFITNLADAGFTEEVSFRITQDGLFRITEDNQFRIIQ
jgi:hypothetical protein